MAFDATSVSLFSPWPDWLEWKPNRVWGYDFTHFTRAQRAAIAILDIVLRNVAISTMAGG